MIEATGSEDCHDPIGGAPIRLLCIRLTGDPKRRQCRSRSIDAAFRRARDPSAKMPEGRGRGSR
jgi:hypothetical protein